MTLMFNWKEIYFDLDRSFYIQFVNLKVEDKYIDLFRQFLGIPKVLWKNVHYEFVNSSYANADTTIEFEHQENKDFTEKQWIILDKAKEKFNNLVYNAKQVLRDSYYYLISDESIIETIKMNDYEFTEEGKLI